MASRLLVSGFLFAFFVLSGDETALASFVIQSQDAVTVELKGYNGLADTTLFKGGLVAKGGQTVDTPYRGLALLVFEHGQRYPVIIGEQSFVLNIKNADTLPAFTGSDENECFYENLTGSAPGTGRYDFVSLMIRAKRLLDSTQSIHTVAELNAMKEKMHVFVRRNYPDLQHSDMVMRLIGQYFMMHEYVDFHIAGTPASDIQIQYKKTVIDGVRNWLAILKAHIPVHEVLNYCVSLYYNRSMVSLASLIVNTFRDVAYCPGNELKSVKLSGNLSISTADGNRKGVLNEFGAAIIAFVSDDCPVSMVETVIKARELAAQQKDVKLIVAPLQQLSDKHLAMRKMLISENMFFVNDEQWNKKFLPWGLRLPLFVDITTSKL